MTNEEILLTVNERSIVRKKLNTLKTQGVVPAVLHTPGHESKNIEAGQIELEKVVKKAGKHHPVNLKIDGKKQLSIIKDVDVDPKKHTVRHVVFGAIRSDEKVETEVPVEIVGDSEAEKKSLLLIKQLDAIKIEALPKDLIDSIELDVTSLSEVGDKLHVSDLTVPAGVTVITEQEHTLVTVEETPAQISEESSEGDETTADETQSSDNSPEETKESNES
jgi:large subunit ribosomal protein L25